LGSHGRNAGTANGEFRFANLRKGDYKVFHERLLDRDLLTFDPRGATVRIHRFIIGGR